MPRRVVWYYRYVKYQYSPLSGMLYINGTTCNTVSLGVSFCWSLDEDFSLYAVVALDVGLSYVTGEG